ncbi:hypothetical protein SRHO_G00137700 [Serrasalmus rhombeus]
MMDHVSLDSPSSSEEVRNTEREEFPYWTKHRRNLHSSRKRSFLPSIGQVYKPSLTVNDPFTREPNQTDKPYNTRVATIFKKMQDENIRASKSSFRYHLMPSDDSSVLTQYGGRRIQHDTDRPRRLVKYLDGMDRAHPLQPIQRAQHNSSSSSSCSALRESCSNTRHPDSLVDSVMRKRGKRCARVLTPREEEACFPFASGDFRVSTPGEFLQTEAHLQHKAHKVVDGMKGVHRNMSSDISTDEESFISVEGLSPVDLHILEELRALSSLRSPTPEPPPKPIKPRSSVSRMRSLRILKQSHSTTGRAADEHPSLQQFSGQKTMKPTEPPLNQDQRLVNPEVNLMQAFKLLRAGDWEKKVEGLVCVRFLAEHHRDVLMPKLHDVTLLVIQEVKNLRSVVARAAMSTLGHMFAHLKKAMDKELECVACALLHKSGESNNFIREEVELTLGCMVQNCSPIRVLNALVTTGLSHRNVAVRRCTALTLQKLAELMGAPRILTSKTDLPRRFLVSISQLAEDSAPDIRFHARNVLRLLSTHKDFIKMVDKFIAQRDKAKIKDIVTKLRRV